MPAPDPTQLARLGDLVKRRRLALGMTAEEAAARAGITAKTYARIERGDPSRDISYRKIEPALHWAHGSCLDVLAGAAPTIADPTSEGGTISPVAAHDLEGAVEQAVQDAAIALDGEGVDLSASLIRKLKKDVVEELRKQGYL